MRTVMVIVANRATLTVDGAVRLSENEQLVLDRVVQTRFARASDVARDLKLEPDKVLASLQELKSKDLLAEERSLGGPLLSVYYLTVDGLAQARRTSRTR